ncbi:MAG: glutamine-hydrolyzing carbamoyl-phosphate synthase small subunit [Acidobacteriota bacterium]
MDALLALEDGSVYAGRAFGASAASGGEVVFNTSMAGYQEILSDPSYAGQIIVMTCPEIGNYGANALDMESRRVWARGFVVRELSEDYSSWRANRSLAQVCKEQGVPGISEVDTRALTRRLRKSGVMRGFIAHLGHRGPTAEECVKRARETTEMLGADLVTEVSTREPYAWLQDGEWTLAGGASPTAAEGSAPQRRFRVAAIDFGIKHNILRALWDVGCDVTVLPATSRARDVMAVKPDGVFLSNGPGDPAAVTYGIETVRELLCEKPIFGICLGHQILGIAVGGRTFKLKFGHRGGNHPVKDLGTGKIEITAQNHGFAVDPESLDPALVEVTHVNLNDGTVEGLRHRKLPVYSVQYHPESSPGPHDARHLFRRFVRAMSEGR